MHTGEEEDDGAHVHAQHDRGYEHHQEVEEDVGGPVCLSHTHGNAES